MTMQFPAPRETFAILDLLALRALGAEPSVYCVRGERREAGDLTRQWGIEDLPVSQATPASVVRGMAYALAHPAIAARLVARLVVDNAQRPTHLLKSLALAPRALDVFREIVRRRPDVVHLFWGHQPALVGRLLHDHAPDVVVTQFLGAYDLTMGFRTGARLAAALPVVFTHARANLPLIEAQGIDPAKVVVAHRGIDLERRVVAAGGKVPGRVLGAGGFEEGKGFLEVIEAFARVQERSPGATLTLLGDGPQRAALEARVRALGLRGVDMPGFVPHARVLAEMARSEVFLFLSRLAGERLPNVVKEAMLHDCACVVSETVGIDELVEDGVTGFVVGSRDVEAAAAAVARCLDDPARRAGLLAAAAERVRASFDVRATMRGYLDVWQRLSAPPVP